MRPGLNRSATDDHTAGATLTWAPRHNAAAVKPATVLTSHRARPVSVCRPNGAVPNAPWTTRPIRPIPPSGTTARAAARAYDGAAGRQPTGQARRHALRVGNVGSCGATSP